MKHAFTKILRILGGGKDSAQGKPPGARLARTALSVSRPGAVGRCPDDAALAALADDPRGAPGREELLAHLEGCPRCRRVWMSLRSGAADPASSPSTAEVPGKFRWAWAAGGVAVAAACLFMLWGPWRASQQLDPDFQRFAQAMPSRMVAARGEGQTLALAWDSLPEPALRGLSRQAKSFAAGQFAMQGLLAGEGSKPPPGELTPEGVTDGGTVWTEPGAAAWRELGQASVVLRLWCGKRLELTPEDGKRLAETLERLKARLEREERGERLLEAVRGLGVPASTGGQAGCREALERLDALEQALFPR